MFFSCRRDEGEVRCNPNQSEHVTARCMVLLGRFSELALAKQYWVAPPRERSMGHILGVQRKGRSTLESQIRYSPEATGLSLDSNIF